MIKQEEKPLTYRSGLTTAWLPDTVKHYQQEIEQQAKVYDIDANLAAIIMTLESGGYSRADSGVAKGLMQVTDPTGKDIAAKFLHTPVDKYDLYDAKTSIEFGAAYLRHLRDTFCDADDSADGGNACVEAIAAGYNGGPGAAINLLEGNGLKASETIIYSRNAFNMWRERNASSSPTFDRWKEAGGQSLIDKAEKEQR